MKVKELIKILSEYKNIYKDFENYDIYVEQCSEQDKEHKRKQYVKGAPIQSNGQGWKVIGCGDEGLEEAFKVEGDIGINFVKKYIILYVNY